MSDVSKFKHITNDPTTVMKTRANKLIDSVNAVANNCNISKIAGDYQPGYMYGNVKVLKNNNPLRPIISQVTNPTYNLAKSFDSILRPYISSQYMLNSTNYFIDLLQVSPCTGIIASLVIESLFTNVPIDPTIEIILQLAYNHPNLLAPQIPKPICTK